MWGQIAEGTPDDEYLDVDDVDPVDQQKSPKRRSIAHNILTDGSAVFLSLDIEIGGEYAGMFQLSAEIVWMKLFAGRVVVQDQVEEVVRMASFDSYVKPESEVWDQRCINIHQIHPEDKHIVSANNIAHIWLQFKTWLNHHVGVSETVILVT